MMKMKAKNNCRVTTVIILSIALWVSCGGNYTPKPHGYMRFDLPEKQYQQFDSTGFPYRFQYPAYAKITKPENASAEPYWINIYIPDYLATIYLSYKKIDDNLAELMEDTYQLVYKHTVKAEAISEEEFANPAQKVYGLMYNLGGNTATALQFYVTDSLRNFIRGSLYFYSEPNKDSLAPLIRYIKDDIRYVMETLEWKY